MLCAGYIKRVAKDGKDHGVSDRLVADKAWGDDAPTHLRPLYDKIISQKKPPTVVSIVDIYITGFSDKAYNKLMSAIGVSLMERGLAAPVVKGKLTKYAPAPEAIGEIIGRVRAVILNRDSCSDEIDAKTLLLTALLDAGELIAEHFDKSERAVLKKRLKEIRASGEAMQIREILDYIESLWIAVISTLFMG